MVRQLSNLLTPIFRPLASPRPCKWVMLNVPVNKGGKIGPTKELDQRMAAIVRSVFIPLPPFLESLARTSGAPRT